MTETIRSSREVVIRTEAFAEAVAFYSSVLGLPVSYRTDDIVGFETGAFCLYVERGVSHGPVFELLSTDAPSTKSRLMAAGAIVVEEDARVPRCYIRDPYGVTFNLAPTP